MSESGTALVLAGRKGGMTVCPSRDEFALIDSIRRHASGHPRVVLGIGDDTAIVRFPAPADSLLTVDTLMEGTHFTFPPATPRDAGHKALAVNLSDLAAMAGEPLAAVIGVAWPRQRGVQFAEEAQAGLQQLADDFAVAIAGGDTNIWDGPLVISVTVLGECSSGEPIRRSGAQPGDWIMATGEFGGSLAGHHLCFQPRVREALALRQSASLHAMIDVSDGLAADLHHILDASGVGAVLFADAIPIRPAAYSFNDGRTPLEHALTDGEDFELIFTVSAEEGQRLLDNPPCEVPLSHIGEITKETSYELKTAKGERRALRPQGWEHRFS